MLRSIPATLVVLALGVGLQACQESGSAPPPPAGVPPATPLALAIDKPVRLERICGGRFLIVNTNPFAVTAKYIIQNTNERGERLLPPAPANDPGFTETELVANNSGPVELYVADQLVQVLPGDSTPCAASGPGPGPSFAVAGTSATGRWSAPFSWPIVAVHLHLLQDGNVLSWGEAGDPQVWNPSTNVFTPVPAPSWLFCAGHTSLSDGRLLVAGGHISKDHGLPDANLFTPKTQTWTSVAPMSYGRWYPTATKLANGQVVVLAGRDQNGVTVRTPEVWTGSGWQALTSALRTLPYYPRTFLAPNGKVFYAGELQSTRYLNTSGPGSWSYVADRLYGVRDYGAAVMYEPGKILYVGGGRTTNTAEIIDLNQAVPKWQWTGAMAYPRRHLNATILPTGQVLVTAGTSDTSFNNTDYGVLPAELWDPATGIWTTVASSAIKRGYHATAILLRDGRVLLSGSGDGGAPAPDERNAEIFSPPYLFKGTRPSITRGPMTINYNELFFVATTSPSSIAQVAWLAIGSTTHAFDMNQRFMRLTFTASDSGLTVTAPSSPNLAPPGYYMLFVLSGNGVPSVAKIIRLL